MTVANAKSSPEGEKFALKIISESGKLFTIGYHFPSRSTNFGTLLEPRELYSLYGRSSILHMQH